MRFGLSFGFGITFIAAMLGGGCGSDEAGPGGASPGTDGGDASVGSDDAGRDGNGWFDTGPPCGAPSFLGPAKPSAEGVLTNRPDFHFAKTGGTLDIATAYFDLLKTPTFNSLAMLGDVVNNTKVQQCVPYVERFDVGTQALVASVDGLAYELEGSVVTIVCLDPGGRAIYRAIQNDVPPT